jgi:pimeloyl-[acyl-carrier protein] methyl ester esterase
MTNLLHLKTVGKGPPLVLVHGWGWHSGIWLPLVPYLSHKFQLFMPDLPGCGQSPLLTSSYTFATLVPYLLDILPPKAIWLGWSLGGLLAWWVAIHYPEKVSQLVTVATSPQFISEGDWPGISLTTLERFSANLTSYPVETLNDFLHLQLRGSPKKQILLEALKPHLSYSNPAALAGGLDLLSNTNLRPDLDKMRVPSLHIFGSLDTLVPVKVVDHLQRLLPMGHCKIIPRAGHIPFLSQMDIFLKLLTENLINS